MVCVLYRTYLGSTQDWLKTIQRNWLWFGYD